MTVNGIKINTMFVERTEEGEIILYGSHHEQQEQTLIVVRSTKNDPTLAKSIFGETYSNERFIDKLKDRPTHNFIGRIVGPLSMPISMDRVTFVD